MILNAILKALVVTLLILVIAIGILSLVTLIVAGSTGCYVRIDNVGLSLIKMR
jgi:predicted DNA repair protein MutK